MARSRAFISPVKPFLSFALPKRLIKCYIKKIEVQNLAIHCRLSTLLGERRIKMAELSRMTGISKTTIHAMYHERVQKIDYSVPERICKALDCGLSDILEYVEE